LLSNEWRSPKIELNSHADHLNTPRLVADAAGTTVWRWDQAEPFGNNPADEDPDANSVAFDLPLRFPGQRYDKETNLHYNYFRNYDPGLGIYKQSDLVGLFGGLNTYAYVGGNPLSHIDRYGLAATVDDFVDALKKKFCLEFDENCKSYYERLLAYCRRMQLPGFYVCREAANQLYVECASNNIPICKPPPTSCVPSSSVRGVS
jgi:RHS repeat-associated protein